MLAKNVQNTTISATIIRKDGTKEELGVLCEMKNEKGLKNTIKKILGGNK